MTDVLTQGAWGHGLATIAEPGERVLDTWYPEPELGTDPPGAESRRLGQNEGPHELAAATGRDERRGVRIVVVLTVISSLADEPVDAHDAYLRLHLLSHRLIRPHEADLTGIFGVLPNVAWTAHGPVLPADLPAVRMRFRAAGDPLAVTSIDKFPRMTDYVAPEQRHADREARAVEVAQPPQRLLRGAFLLQLLEPVERGLSGLQPHLRLVGRPPVRTGQAQLLQQLSLIHI